MVNERQLEVDCHNATTMNGNWIAPVVWSDQAQWAGEVGGLEASSNGLPNAGEDQRNRRFEGIAGPRDQETGRTKEPNRNTPRQHTVAQKWTKKMEGDAIRMAQRDDGRQEAS